MKDKLPRREVLARLAAFGLAVPAAPALTVRDTWAATNSATPSPTPAGLVHKGINYDVGTRLLPAFTSREQLPREFMVQEIGAIRDHLHCTSIGIYGSDTDRLIEGATVAADAGLHVWLQPRLTDTGVDDTLRQIAEVATAAEALASRGPGIVFDVGCELTLFAQGIIPGESFDERLATLLATLDQIPVYNEQLNDLLRRAVTETKAHFSGPVTYGSGSWESVDWREFDYVGVDLYRDATSEADYTAILRSYHAHDKPVVIREFGCCCYEGAEDQGSLGNAIVDWGKVPPQLNGDYVRDESVQATYLAELLDIFAREAVHGAFVYQFIEPYSTYDPNPRYDLDMASFAVVKVYPADSDKSYAKTGYWEAKEAFGELAKRFGGT
jgi:hypothetical protein